MYGGLVDTFIQRVIEVVRSIPTIPALDGPGRGAAEYLERHPGLFRHHPDHLAGGWPELARVVRGRFLALREEDFVIAAELVGCRAVPHHPAPHAAVVHQPYHRRNQPRLAGDDRQRDLAAFLGLGLRPPAISWGILLQDAQNVQALAGAPWLLITAVPVILVILAFNFLGDGLRDAADPYG